MTQNWDKYKSKEVQMVVKVDKSEEFIKSGRKLISEYDNKTFFMEEKDEKEQYHKIPSRY